MAAESEPMFGEYGRTHPATVRRAQSARAPFGYVLRLATAGWLTALVCSAALLPSVMAHRVLHPPRVVGTGTPAQFGLPYEEVAFAGAGIQLRGWYVPARGEAAIVLVHGFLSERRELLDLVPPLHEAGFDLLLYDQRGAGLSEGDGVTFGYYEARDLIAAAAYLRARSGAARLGALGVSQGAATVLLAAGADATLAAVVADSPFADLEQVAAEGAARLYGPLYGLLSPLLSPLMLWHAERQSGLRAALVRPIDAVRRISPRPVLLIHGLDDRLYGSAHSEALYAAAGEPKALWLVPGAPHAGARFRQPAEYRRRLLAFFRAALLPGRAAGQAPAVAGRLY